MTTTQAPQHLCAPSIARDPGRAGRPTTLTYLATPYTHTDPEEMAARAALAARVAAAMKARGETVFAPVAYGHMLSIHGGAGRRIEDWASECRAWIERATGMAVLDIDASYTSRGVRHDIEVARGLGLPVRFVDLAGQTVRTPAWALVGGGGA